MCIRDRLKEDIKVTGASRTDAGVHSLGNVCMFDTNTRKMCIRDRNEIELVTNTVQPRGSKEELSKIKDNLGGFSTDFSSSAAGRACLLYTSRCV